MARLSLIALYRDEELALAIGPQLAHFKPCILGPCLLIADALPGLSISARWWIWLRTKRASQRRPVSAVAPVCNCKPQNRPNTDIIYVMAIVFASRNSNETRPNKWHQTEERATQVTAACGSPEYLELASKVQAHKSEPRERKR